MTYPELIHAIIIFFGVIFILLGCIVNYKKNTHLLFLIDSNKVTDVAYHKDIMHIFKVNIYSGIVFICIGINGFYLGGTPFLSFLIVGSIIGVLVNENLT